MEIRGPGEVLGIRQSGLAELHLADLTKDLYILEMAREEAKDYVQNNKSDEYPKALQEYIKSQLSAVENLTAPD